MCNCPQGDWKGLGWGIVSWFFAGIGLTLGHLFIMWLLRLCHLA